MSLNSFIHSRLTSYSKASDHLIYVFNSNEKSLNFKSRNTFGSKSASDRYELSEDEDSVIVTITGPNSVTEFIVSKFNDIILIKRVTNGTITWYRPKDNVFFADAIDSYFSPMSTPYQKEFDAMFNGIESPYFEECSDTNIGR